MSGAIGKEFDKRVTKRYESMREEFDKLDAMSASMLRSYCVVCEQIDDLNSRIKTEGYFVDTDKGPKENPAVNTVHKLNADKARYFAPLKRVLVRQEAADDAAAAEEAAKAEMDAFLGL